MRAFAVHEVRYLVVGGVAYSTHVKPRFADSLEVWVDANPLNGERVWRGLAQFGAPLRGVTPTDFSRPGVVYQVGVPPRRVDVLTRIEGVEFVHAWRERLELQYAGVPVHVIGAAELLVNKRAVGRPRDLLDAKDLERVIARRRHA
ncbi:MAG: hypothetical protein JNN27_19025 [Planctomycetes bacterium]|nr:hypothetical protein [Planctomycetota bacterium]